MVAMYIYRAGGRIGAGRGGGPAGRSIIGRIGGFYGVFDRDIPEGFRGPAEGGLIGGELPADGDLLPHRQPRIDVGEGRIGSCVSIGRGGHRAAFYERKYALRKAADLGRLTGRVGG